MSVNGYLIRDIAKAGLPLPPAVESGLWYQYYFQTERGCAGLTANRREVARTLWTRNSPTWRFDGATLDRHARAFVAAAEAGRRGLWHVTDDEPATIKDMLVEFARQFGAPAPRRVPLWLARLVVPKVVLDFFTRSTQTSNRLFRDAVGGRRGFRPSARVWRMS